MRALSRLAALAASALVAACASGTSAGDTPAPQLLAPRGTDSVQLVTASGTLHGTLELPAGGRPVPVVLIHAGSGPTDRDGNSRLLSGPNNSLRQLAESLAARGIASVRYDKRGVGASQSALASETGLRFEHLVQDGAAWIRQLRADPRFSTVAVLGHSEGSLVMMLAAREAGADGVVSLNGLGRRASDVLRAQLAPQLPPALAAQSERILVALEAGRTADSVPTILASLYRPSVQPYLISWFAHDPQRVAASLAVPLLVAQGTTDIQATRADADRLAAAGPGTRLLMVEGMNHVLKLVGGPPAAQLPSYSDPTLPISPLLVDGIATFVKELAPRSGRPAGD